MDVIVAQFVGLTAAGQAFLHADADPDALLADHPAFNLCADIAFVEQRPRIFGGMREVVVTKSIAEWLNTQRKRGASRFSIAYSPLHLDEERGLSVSEIGSGLWATVVQLPACSEIWITRLEDVEPHGNSPAVHATGKLYNLFFGLVQTTFEFFPDPPADLEPFRTHLRNAIEPRLHWALSTGAATLAARSRRALDLLESASPDHACRAMGLVALDHYPLVARQILAATGETWPNAEGDAPEVSLDDETELGRLQALSLTLYDVITRALPAAVNVFNHHAPTEPIAPRN